MDDIAIAIIALANVYVIYRLRNIPFDVMCSLPEEVDNAFKLLPEYTIQGLKHYHEKEVTQEELAVIKAYFESRIINSRENHASIEILASEMLMKIVGDDPECRAKTVRAIYSKIHSYIRTLHI
jgi:hypothetical protein